MDFAREASCSSTIKFYVIQVTKWFRMKHENRVLGCITAPFSKSSHIIMFLAIPILNASPQTRSLNLLLNTRLV